MTHGKGEEGRRQNCRVPWGLDRVLEISWRKESRMIPDYWLCDCSCSFLKWKIWEEEWIWEGGVTMSSVLYLLRVEPT